MPTEYAIYLRKSRADLEAEAAGEGDTLARHEQILMNLAKSRALPIGAIYREVVSGERIANRPFMQQLLSEVEGGRWKGVLVTEASRLARGDTIDQGIVAQAFKFSGTLIVTPSKTYDLTQETDEEWTEFSLFMARQEYRMIRRRMTAGTKAAKQEGRFVGSRAPYGYERVKLNGRGWSIRPIEPQAGVVRGIYERFLSGLGYNQIAKYLNGLQIPSPSGQKWVRQTVILILQNPHYAGLIPSAVHPYKRIARDQEVVITRPKDPNCALYEGKHEAIIPRDTWNAVQRELKDSHTPRVPSARQQHNPFAGLIFCDQCGKRMQRHPPTARNFERIECVTVGCPTTAAAIEQVEALVLQSLREFLHDLAMSSPEPPDTAAEENAIKHIEKEIDSRSRRLKRTFELIEDGTYDRATFLARQSEISGALEELRKARADLIEQRNRKDAERAALENEAPVLRHVLSAYDPKSDAATRNKLLKQVIARIDYHKTTSQRWSKETDLSLTVHPKISSRP